MVCLLVRHGKDDETIRGGWSNHRLTEEGEKQAVVLACKIASYTAVQPIKAVYSSDLERASETARIIADRLGLPVTLLPQFREVNNGLLAGMKNDLAQQRFPGLFWNQLDWEESYPEGESPKLFYERVKNAWDMFSSAVSSNNQNVLLVTHGGVIQAILSLINHEHYSNKLLCRRIPYAGMTLLTYEDGEWCESRREEYGREN